MSIDTNAKFRAAIIDWFTVNPNPITLENVENTTPSAYKTYYGPISQWKIGNGVTDMANVFDAITGPYTDLVKTSIESFNQDISAWDTSNVLDMTHMFYGAKMFNNGQKTGQFKALENTPGSNAWKTSRVTTMAGMFKYATMFNQDISSWDTSNVLNMKSMFSGANKFNNGAKPLNNVPGSNVWNTNNVTTMSQMFLYAIAFNQNISLWDTSKVLDMAVMFGGAKKFNNGQRADKFKALAYIPGSNVWKTSGVTTMNGMFSEATAFNQDISSWDTSGVLDMNGMFGGATTFNNGKTVGQFKALENLTGSNIWNTSIVTNMSCMFYNAAAFNQDISSWNTSKVLDMSHMFQLAIVYKGDGVNNWKLVKNTKIKYMFIESGVLASNNKIFIWNSWKNNYGYSDTKLKDAGLNKEPIMMATKTQKNTPTPMTWSMNATINISFN
jgi:surface protein